MSGHSPIPGLFFSLLTPSATRFGPRLGNVLLKRDEQTEIQIQTPSYLASTSRGVIPHLSRDHYASSGIRWVNIPFESFLDVLPPVPTLVDGKNSLHTFLGYSLGQHVVSMAVRDPADGREMPPNGNAHVAAYSLRGVRKVTPTEWKSYVYSCKPDIVFALADIPLTHPPYSQKRLTKSIERSASWLASLISPLPNNKYRPSVLVHMAGTTSVPARRAFAESLIEKLFGPEAETIKPLQTLDQGVTGYTFDLIPIRLSLEAAEKRHQDPFYPPAESIPPTPPPTIDSAPTPLSEVNLDPTIPAHTDQLSPLLQASLEPLSTTKLRLVNSVQTPHEILRLISSVGIDIFDAHWAQRAGDVGVALDFTFPAPSSHSPALKARENNKLDIGHNLYCSSYTHDFSAFGSASCGCRACSPVAPATRIYHGVDDPSFSGESSTIPSQAPAEPRVKPSFSRAYAHHLLHTHEMSAHSLLVLHNLSVLDQFFGGIRTLLQDRPEKWDQEVKRFEEIYDEELKVFEEARVMWRDVDLARGKGRLVREKAKQEEGTLGTAVEL
ncbi:hypothetical protein P691DRAFT_712883 [Macrolepiota fuliginosa MF-IS2]|uniref:tRNA-guanine(15) transglycosylase-like domain-containing protein n=1 Tax=Macrolepiota fuliginosa MF-IS2 TaxID=1400762 RepID=A0A9P6BZM8_9AGAR|nr:hypothetical protein P691DRAFT_712883 [Macrolepiota fuliginosa MF-IS2]